MARPLSQDALSARELVRLELRVALDEVGRVCELSVEQRATLMRLAEEKLVLSDEDADEAPRISPIPLHRTEGWTESLRGVLTPEQLRAWRETEEDRRRRRREATAARYVAAVQCHLWLGPEQRDLLQQGIASRSSSPPDERQLDPRFRSTKFANDPFLPEAVSEIRSSDLEGIVTPRQLELWAHLRREVLEPNDELRELLNGAALDSVPPVPDSVRQELVESAAALRLEAELDALDETVDLDASQRRKLELIARTIQARLRELPERECLNEIVFFELPFGARDPDEYYDGPKLICEVRTESLEPDRVLYLDPVWSRALARLLRPDQLRAVMAGEREHRDSRIQSIAAVAVSVLDERLLLSADQRLELRKALVEVLDVADNVQIEWIVVEPASQNVARAAAPALLLLPRTFPATLLSEAQTSLWMQLRKSMLGGDILPLVNASFVVDRRGRTLELSIHPSQ